MQAKDWPQSRVRLPERLRGKLKEEATKNYRTFNSEIVMILEGHFEAKEKEETIRTESNDTSGLQIMELLVSSFIRSLQADEPINVSAVCDLYETIKRDKGQQTAWDAFGSAWDGFMSGVDAWKDARDEFKRRGMQDPKIKEAPEPRLGNRSDASKAE